MSRIGKKPIEMPSGVSCKITPEEITITGPLGNDTCKLTSGIKVKQDNNTLTIEIIDQANLDILNAHSGLMRSLISNIVIGVTKGFEENLEIQGVGYRVAQKGDDLEFSLGFSHPVLYKTKPGIKLQAIDPTHLKISGVCKQVVGQVAAEIRGLKEPEPYKGKGIRYANESVRRKAGKTGKK